MAEATRKTPCVSLVVARADNGIIGRDNSLPWRLPADLKHFKRLTVGKPVIMGRKTFESIGKPLPARHNIVVTRNPEWTAEGVTVAPNLAEAIAASGLDPKTRADEIMVIGGAEIYAQAMPFAHRIYLTEVHVEPVGDTSFPMPDPHEWAETARETFPEEDDFPAYSFVTLERRS
ncbi:dihydrofolate reductase [Pedomonas mirosovicensis]|uniref:dihydrofolate reductase n=1 Tax=Pedomonas mirosovicensis TaxID=2908641 RepID=UPI0021679FAF|nr:dihydrofolate reductase [Pedomonas mirosovicensis]MCH8684589.1 dihydrofolate reductase [Pedomonas mirosovicensis]